MTGFIDLAGMALFVKIVESGSLAAAGRLLGLPKATVSRQLADIENRMGAPLLLRSTRALSLTDTGRRYYERIRPIVLDAEMAQADALAEHATPGGLLRISAPVAYGQHVLAPKLFAFQRSYPLVRIDLQLTDERVNIISAGFDLAVRIGRLDDSELISRQIDQVEMMLVASPAYLAQVGTPETIADLQNLKAIITRPQLDHWNINGEALRMRWHMSTGNMLVTRDAICAGLGVGLVPAFLCHQLLADGALVRVLADAVLDRMEVSAIRARSVITSVAVRALLTAIG